MTIWEAIRVGLALRRLSRKGLFFFYPTWCGAPGSLWICSFQRHGDEFARPYTGKTALEAVCKAEAGAPALPRPIPAEAVCGEDET